MDSRKRERIFSFSSDVLFLLLLRLVAKNWVHREQQLPLLYILLVLTKALIQALRKRFQIQNAFKTKELSNPQHFKVPCALPLVHLLTGQASVTQNPRGSILKNTLSSQSKFQFLQGMSLNVFPRITDYWALGSSNTKPIFVVTLLCCNSTSCFYLSLVSCPSLSSEEASPFSHGITGPLPALGLMYMKERPPALF